MDAIALPGTSSMSLSMPASDSSTLAKLRDTFTFTRMNSSDLMETLRTAFSPTSNAGALASSLSSSSSALSSDSVPATVAGLSSGSDSDTHDDDDVSAVTPVSPASTATSTLSMSPGDPYDLALVDPVPIAMVDHSMDDDASSGKMWARSAWVGDFSIVSGATKASTYVSWLCVIETVERRTIKFRKRYSEFVALQTALCKEYPLLRAAIPGLPPKSIISKFRPAFLEERRRGLEFFLACIILNPVFTGSQVVKEFISSSSSVVSEDSDA
ncbi:Phox homologous domain-containing protein [Lipomyces oligophaga]|uniref:Phox homologous domain-containing protein n=1 Tax=Lipomyces oligophaga TaxID=45792 RepID=UPI0034CE451E